MQDFELESFSMGADHSQMVKAAPFENDYGSKDSPGKGTAGMAPYIIFFTKIKLTYKIIRQ